MLRIFSRSRAKFDLFLIHNINGRLGVHHRFGNIIVLSAVQIVVLRILFGNCGRFKSCAFGVDHFVLSTSLCIGIVVKMIVVVLMGDI